MLVNFSDQTLTVPKSTILGIAEEAPEPLIDRINQRKELNSDLSQDAKQEIRSFKSGRQRIY